MARKHLIIVEECNLARVLRPLCHSRRTGTLYQSANSPVCSVTGPTTTRRIKA